ncbi:MAG: branched-chain amino acid ABC transporter permease [Thermovirgaceae bacterium]|nr:branched-chain amino acid ABC transporter permease [Thermovirgaceae bacterium]
MSNYVLTIGIFVAINGIVACGLNIIVGYAGQISLGHAAFFGIGAYTAALLATRAGFSFWLSLPLVIIITGAIGLLLGLPSLRVRADFLAITTIGINFIVESVFMYVPFFGGALGIGGISRILFFGIRLREAGFLALAGTLLVLSLGCTWWFARSWTGLACFALREDETSASSIGISPVLFKLLAFMTGTAMAGVGGSLYAHYMRFISATDFGFPVSVMMLSMVVVGGMGTLWGPVIGALLLTILPEVFRPLTDYRMLLYAVLLLLMIRFQPGGLLGERGVLKNLAGRIRGRLRS